MTNRIKLLGLIVLVVLLCALAKAQESGVGSSPRQVFVVNTQDASVSLVDIASMKEVRRIPVGLRPYGVVVSRDGRRIAVGVEDEQKVKFYDTTEFKLLGETRIGKMFNDHMVLSQDGQHVLVANFYSDDVVAVDVETMKETFRIKGASAPHVIKYGPLRKHAYVTCKKITGIAIVDPQNQKLVKFHQINVNPRSLTFSPDESKVYFGSFWVDGFFEMDSESGKVTRLFALSPPATNSAPQEVTYHGVEMVFPGIVLAANEGRSYVDAVDVRSGKQLDRLTAGVAKPCCVERIPNDAAATVRVLVSNIEDGTLQLVEVSTDGKMRSIAKARVGKAPKRVAFMPNSR
jgi:YVTN family beta-propeller protein